MKSSAVKNALKMLDAAVTPPAEPEPPPKPPEPVIPLTWAMLHALLTFAKLPDDKTRQRLDNLGLQFQAELDGLKGFSHQDAGRDFRGAIRSMLDGKLDASKLPTKAELIQRNSDIRRVARHRASLVSLEGCQLAASVLERALGSVPDFTEQLRVQESALFPGATLPASPLQRLCGELPAFVEMNIKKLRSNSAPMMNPSHMLKP